MFFISEIKPKKNKITFNVNVKRLPFIGVFLSFQRSVVQDLVVVAAVLPGVVVAGGPDDDGGTLSRIGRIGRSGIGRIGRSGIGRIGGKRIDFATFSSDFNRIEKLSKSISFLEGS